MVRLKGGDPLVFGRAGEEIEALRQAGVDFEIVPGVSAAFGAAAAAGIALTDRRFASQAVFLTNHRCRGKGSSLHEAVGSKDATIVVYMPGANYHELSQHLIGPFFPQDTPCLVVSRATSAQQKILSTTLSGLVDAEGLPAPSIVIVGGVAGSYREDHRKKIDLVAEVASTADTLDERVDPILGPQK